MIKKNNPELPEYYKYLKLISKYSNYNILDIHVMLKKCKKLSDEKINELVEIKKFSNNIDLVDLIIILDNELKKK